MSTHGVNNGIRIKVGLFTALSLLLIGVLTILVNHKPYFFRHCQLVHIQVDDATGLRMKSAVRSMGINIGYLKSVALEETHVDLGICVTAPVEILPTTRAYIRSEGFLGDKFVELRPVKYVGSPSTENKARDVQPSAMLDWIESSAWADEAHAANRVSDGDAPPGEREIPVGSKSQDMQQVINRVDKLVNEMTSLTSNLRQAINPEQLKSTMKQLNITLQNASKTLSPQGGLNQTAQRTLAKLEDAVEQLRDQVTRINQGQGSLGRIINDPVYAEELKTALDSINRLLDHTNQMHFIIDIGGEEIRGYSNGRGWFKLQIWPSLVHYYLLGISVDPRGLRTITQTTTTSGGVTSVVDTTQIEQTGLLFTGMVGKVFYDDRLDLSIGALYGDGAVSAMVNLGPRMAETTVQVRSDFYIRGNGIPWDLRTEAYLRPFLNVYLLAGLESIRQVNGVLNFTYGGGVAFDDEGIKLLFALIGVH